VSPRPEVAFKILTGEEWADFQASGRFEGSPADRVDGFIHLSAADQVDGTLARHFAGRNGLVLAEIDLAALGDSLRWEESRGGALFPHLYGALPLAAVRSAGPIA
jgi:ornithine lipid ester-linked acyl 2-hydroxylase